MDGSVSPTRRRSVMWKHFTRKGNHIASCNICKKDYSYKATITNLKKHWRNSHANDCNDNDSDVSDDEQSNHSDVDTKPNIKGTVKNAIKSTWQYFEVLDSDKFAAKCKLCDMEVHYESLSDLRKHVKQHDAVLPDDEDWQEDDRFPKIYKTRSKTSKLWQYMKVIDKTRRHAICRLCRKSLSFLSTVNNLKKHLARVHPHVDIDDEEELEVDTNKILISQNGEIFEVATSDREKDPIQTNGTYLDDSNDEDIEESLTKTEIPRHVMKERKIERISTVKELIPNTHNDIHETIYKETSLNTPNVFTNSTVSMGSVDYFGQYIVSLLKEMPKHVAGQLQSDIIKQIFTAKVALETPYSVTLNEKPVTVTINNDTGPIPEITVLNSSDVAMKENNEN